MPALCITLPDNAAPCLLPRMHVPAEPQSDAGQDLLREARELHNRWQEFRMRGAGLPSIIRDYCTREGIEDYVWAAVDMAREFFPSARMACFQLVQDPEGGDEWLAIRLAVGGGLSVADILDRYNAYTDAWLDIAPESVEGKIRVSFNKV